jgi:thiamine pyrophosphokinase
MDTYKIPAPTPEEGIFCMVIVIFANGELHITAEVLSVLNSAGIVVAADGGAAHCLNLGIIPQAIIGDLDSFSENDLARMVSKGSKIIRHPARKDHTDLELALQYAISREPDEIIILGALGKRWDQTLANLLLPAGEQFSQAIIRLIDGRQEINLIRPEQDLHINGQIGDTVSLIPLYGDASGITTEGLEYPLVNGDLLFGSTKGISNVLVDNSAKVAVTKGILVCVVIHTS